MLYLIGNCFVLLLSLFIFLVGCKIINQAYDEWKFHHWYRKNTDKTMDDLLNDGAESIKHLTASIVEQKTSIFSNIKAETQFYKIQNSGFKILEYKDV
jgi:hypothetical protein